MQNIKAVVLVAALVLVLFGGTEVGAQETSVPDVGARAWTIVDLRTGEPLAGENADERLPMASTTKIMLAFLTLEEANLEREVVVSRKAASFAVPPYSNVGLFPGDTVSVRGLLMASLIASGDDAAYALAEDLGGGSVEQCVGEMNRRAKALGLEDTHFENPVGFDAPDHHSSARDLAKLTRLAFAYPEFREIVATAEAEFTTQDRSIPLVNTNELLFTYELATGVKTGTTPAAGPSLVAAGASGNESYVTVVLDDEERFADTRMLLDHGFETYDRRPLILENRQYGRVDVPYRRGETIGLVAKNSVPGLVDGSSEVEREVAVDEDLPDSLRPGDQLGTITAKVNGEPVGETPLVARRGYEKASLGEKLWYTVEGVIE